MSVYDRSSSVRWLGHVVHIPHLSELRRLLHVMDGRQTQLESLRMCDLSRLSEHNLSLLYKPSPPLTMEGSPWEPWRCGLQRHQTVQGCCR
mmetsp:Transcript_27930/g.73710  ORF Transcript_27930/g.73710 Transcript_27930/m.73710 type:complete len:91 (+) Transcript_27930:1658-1930(+)